MSDNTTMNFEQAAELIQKVRQRINGQLLGQTDIVDQVIIALLANGHILIEGVPGLGKTLLVKVLANSFNGQFKRIQFTPDLMPADITGHVMYDMKESRFRLRRGPVFTNLLLADEINRAPAKTQAALLEVMQEHKVTLEGTPQPVPTPFMVLATQNPIEQEGTYPLPEAELDRFMLKVNIDYPSQDDEVSLTKMVTDGTLSTHSESAESQQEEALLSSEGIAELQALVAQQDIDDQVVDYAVRLVRATRDHTSLYRGASPRACIALVRAARAQALLQNRNFVLPDDVKAMALPVIRHRVQLAAEMEIDGHRIDDILSQVFAAVEAPRV